MGPERTLSDHLGNVPVNSPTRITPENNGKILPQLARGNAFAKASGGRGVRQIIGLSGCFYYENLKSCRHDIPHQDVD